MKHLLLFLAIASAMALQAQPILNSNEMAPFGTSWTSHYTGNLNLIDTTIQGQGVTWDFSQLQKAVDSFTVQIVDPATTPNASSFPNSNYAYLEGPATAYRYFNLTSTTLERVGSWSAGSGIKTYSDPQVEYVFPFQYGSYNMDTWDNSLSSTGGIYELECIGTGTLILPMGTFNDVLMVRAYVEEWIIALDAYYWYDSNNGIVLLQYVIGDGVFVSSAATFATNISLLVGIEENDRLANIKYNNPVADMLTVSISGMENYINYQLINTMGQVVKSGESIDPGSNLQIDMENMQSGIYFLTLSNMSSSAVKTLKVVKI